MRSQIGRVFRGKAWISNLSVLENITLARVFHSGHSRAGIHAELESVMHDAGLDGIPSCRPHELSEADSQVCQWIRAFLGPRRLVLLEDPAGGVPDDRLEGLGRLTRRCVEMGGAVAWVTSRDGTWKSLSIKPSRIASLRNGQWIVREGG